MFRQSRERPTCHGRNGLGKVGVGQALVMQVAQELTHSRRQVSRIEWPVITCVVLHERGYIGRTQFGQIQRPASELLGQESPGGQPPVNNRLRRQVSFFPKESLVSKRQFL